MERRIGANNERQDTKFVVDQIYCFLSTRKRIATNHDYG